jgi:hypothetical protein
MWLLAMLGTMHLGPLLDKLLGETRSSQPWNAYMWYNVVVVAVCCGMILTGLRSGASG